MEDAKSNLLETEYMKTKQCREPLSQFVQHKMPVFNDDTESEKDSMDEMKEQLAKEANNLKTGKCSENKEIDQILEETEPMGISFYRSYLEWFTQNELIRILPSTSPPKSKPTDSVKHHESEITKPESCENPSAQMTISPPKFSPTEQLDIIQEDIEMKEEQEQQPPIIEASEPEYIIQDNEEEKTESLDKSMEICHYTQEMPIEEEPIEIQPQPVDQIEQYDQIPPQPPQFDQTLSDLDLDLSITYQKQQINAQVLLQTNKKINDKNAQLNQLYGELARFEQQMAQQAQEHQIDEKTIEDEYQEKKHTLMKERQDNQQFEDNQQVQDEQQLASLANLSELDTEIQKMEIEISKKQREMELKKIKLGLIKKIKVLDEEYKQGREQRSQSFEQKGEELRTSQDQFQHQIDEVKQELFEKQKIIEDQEQAKIILAEEYKQIHEKIDELKNQQERMRIEKEQEAERLERLRLQEVERVKQNQVSEQERQRAEEKQRRIEIEKKKMIIMQQQRMKQEQQRLQKIEEEKKLKEKQNQVQEDDDDLDWQEGAHNERSYDEEEDWRKNMEVQAAISLQERQRYIETMSKKFASGLNKEIRKCETRDLARRDIKSKLNNDKLHDFMQIKKIKQDKLDQQRRQIQGENSSSPPDSKEDSLKGTTDDQKLKYIKDCSNYRKDPLNIPHENLSLRSSSKHDNLSFKSSSKLSETVSVEENIDKYNLFDADNNAVNEGDPKLDLSSDYNQEGLPPDIPLKQSPKKSPKKHESTFQSPQQSSPETPQDPDAQAKSAAEWEAMKKQVAFLQQSLQSMTQQLNQHNYRYSQQGNKQGPPVAELADVPPKIDLVPQEGIEVRTSEPHSQEDDYPLPTFGAQIPIPKAKAVVAEPTVKPFNPNGNQKLKRTFTEMEAHTLGRNALAELADKQRIDEHKKKVEHEKKKKLERDAQLKHQVRKSIGHPELHHHTYNHNNQQMEAAQRRDRQRARSQSQDRQQPMQNSRARIEQQNSSGKPGSNPQRRPGDLQKVDPNPRHGGQMMGGANRMDGPKRHTAAHSQYNSGETPRVKNVEHMNQVYQNDNLKRRRYSETLE